MIARSYRIDEGPRLTSIQPETVRESLQEPEAKVWLDLLAFDQGELEEWLNLVGVQQMARRLCLEARDRPGFYPLRTELFFVLPVLSAVEGTQETEYVAVLCRKNLLLTLHRTSLFGPERIVELDESESWLTEPSVAALVAAMLIDLSQTCLNHAAALREIVASLDARMDVDPDSVDPDEIRDVRSDLLALGTVANDQLPSVQALNTTERPFFRLDAARESMHCALVNLQAAHAVLSRLEKHVGALRSGMEMYAQEKTNGRLGMLTILSAIFMPITLLAGIWGMNFESMPELGIAFGYPIALGCMALIGTGMFLFFRRGGWFG